MKQPALLLTMQLAPLAFAAATTGVSAADLFVSPAGNDGGSGARATPFATLQKARGAASTAAGKLPGQPHKAPSDY